MVIAVGGMVTAGGMVAVGGMVAAGGMVTVGGMVVAGGIIAVGGMVAGVVVVRTKVRVGSGRFSLSSTRVE